MTNTTDSQKPSLLVVDDEESVRTPLNYAFKQQYNMFLCSNSAEALAVVDSYSDRRVIGLLTEAFALRRYAAELERRRKELVGGE